MIFCPRAALYSHTINAPTYLSTAIRTHSSNKTNVRPHVTNYQITGDGNCFFRALSLGLTQSQEQHDLLRSFVVNHMLDATIRGGLQRQFMDEGVASDFDDYLERMLRPGEWGTELEIIADAHLFNCYIMCVCSNPDNQIIIQHFPLHFVASPVRTSECKHGTRIFVSDEWPQSL